MKRIVLMSIISIFLFLNVANADLLKFSYDGSLEVGIWESINIDIDIDIGGNDNLQSIDLQVWFNDNLLDFNSGQILSYKETLTSPPFGDDPYWGPLFATPYVMTGLNKIDGMVAAEDFTHLNEFKPVDKGLVTLVTLWFQPLFGGNYDVSELVSFAGAVPGTLDQKGSSVELNSMISRFGVEANPYAVPIPSSLLLLGGGIFALLGITRRKKG